MRKRKPLIIAHRGAKSLAKHENTLESFQIAIDMKLNMVEFDIRQTKDKQLVIYHNPTIAHKKISDLTYRQLTIIAQKKRLEIPLLETVLQLCQGKIRLDVEIKEPGYEKEVVSLVTRYFGYDEFIMISFYDSVIKKVKLLDPKIRTGLLIGLENATLRQRIQEIYPVQRLKNTNADFVAAHYYLVTRFLLYLCKKHHYDLVVWTVNRDKVFHKLRKQRVTAIVTDYPQNYVNS
ncbi:glycerophosphodiester phosphodiesterase [Anaerosporobacter faecicola]|uniref:glycerophosphodiester phosphodiesterase n=1 Tax=Anaerosporobacter faecicola TaxID=2718714 RepID=UPI00143C9F63|nr:glycerophosphodiester phosphodiesterase [Anaerosporobacter faecicola]